MIPQNIQNYTPFGEVLTGETWFGQPVYRRFFRGTSPANGVTVVIAPPSEGIGRVIRCAGWVYTNNPSYAPVEEWCTNGQFERLLIRVLSTGLTLFVNSAGAFSSRPYELSVDYVRGYGFGINLP